MKTLFDDDLTLEDAEELIRNGADVNEEDVIGATPLFYVLDYDVFRLLIDHGANVNALNYLGSTPLCYVEDIDMMKLLIKHGANVNALNYLGSTPLFYAKNIDIAEFFIKNGALLNIRNTYGDSALDTFHLISKPFTPRKDIECLINHGLIFGKIKNYQKYRDLFNLEQQKAFDSFLLLTSNDDDFFAMCLAYQEGIKNHVKIDIKNMEIL